MCYRRPAWLPRWPTTGSVGSSAAVVPLCLPRFPCLLLHLASTSFFTPFSHITLHHFPRFCIVCLDFRVIFALLASISVPLLHVARLHHFACQHLFYLHIACICIVLRVSICFICIPLAFASFCVPHLFSFAYRLPLHRFPHPLLLYPLHVACIAWISSQFCFIACICIRTVMITALVFLRTMACPFGTLAALLSL